MASSVVQKQRKILLQSVGYNDKDLLKWSHKWHNLKARAKRIGRGCTLTFEDYVSMAQEAGIKHPGQIGSFPGCYQVGRNKDQGPYEKGNCSFISKEENLKQRWMYKNK